MNIFCSELCLIGGTPKGNVKKIMAAGINHIELMLDGAGWNDFHLRKEELASSLLSLDATYSIHTPVWDVNLTSENAHMRQAAMDAYRESIRFARMLDAKHVVIHPGFCYAPVFDKAVARQRARQAIESLLEFNRDYGQLLLIENVGNPSTSIFSQQEYAAFLDGLPGEAGYLLDVGHAYINRWDLGQLIPQLGDRLHALHLHDNDGGSDAHLPISSGSVDWEALFHTLSRQADRLHLVLEYNIGTPLARVKEGVQMIQSLARH